MKFYDRKKEIEALRQIERLSATYAQMTVITGRRRKWFSRKYYASVMNIKEFYEDNIGRSFTGIISNALNKNFGRSGSV